MPRCPRHYGEMPFPLFSLPCRGAASIEWDIGVTVGFLGVKDSASARAKVTIAIHIISIFASSVSGLLSVGGPKRPGVAVSVGTNYTEL